MAEGVAGGAAASNVLADVEKNAVAGNIDVDFGLHTRITTPAQTPAITELGVVTDMTHEKSADGLTFTFQWPAVPGATHYDVSWKAASVDSGNWQTIKDVSGNSIDIETAKLPTDQVTYAIIAKSGVGDSTRAQKDGKDNWSKDFTF